MDNRIREILKILPNNKTVLDIGCAQNPNIHIDISKKSKKTVGIDINDKGLNTLRKKGLEVYNMNAENINLKEKFDYIIAGELIEHLDNPGLFLSSLKTHLKKNGRIILTTPNISSILLYFLVVVLDKTQDPTHVYYFDRKNLEVLLSRYDLKITECRYVPPEIKFHGEGLIFKIIFFLSTFIANIGYIFSRRLFGSYLLLIIENKS